jgi:hypothetical protein
MESSVEYMFEENEPRAKYTNLFYINNKFHFLTTSKEIELKKVRTTITDELIPEIIRFENIELLNNYVKLINYTEISEITGYFSHFYNWNVAHGLYDSLYPLFLTYLRLFFNNVHYNDEHYDNERKYDVNKFNIFINLKFIPGWSFPGIASRDWVLDIFKQFSGGIFIKENDTNSFIKENFKFETMIMGNALAGLTAVNKNGQMPGRDIFALEKFRDRMFDAYNIRCKNKNHYANDDNKKPVIRIINSRRYSDEEIFILHRIVNELKNRGYDSEYINWENISSFKEQLEIMHKTDIHIAGAGTSMLNFPFLNNNSVHINLGANPVVGLNIPGLMEVNICLLSNNIKCDYYDIFNHLRILYEPLTQMINSHISNKDTFVQIIPEYIQMWRTYCKNDENKNIDILIKRMNGIIQPHLMTYRWVECLKFNIGPFSLK